MIEAAREGQGPAPAPAEPRKVGLGLSGGGHRAAFFHIGVLARLAELGRLREVEVISTVSGGSFLGALYYLLVKRILETTPNRDIEDAQYVDAVHELERRYRAAAATSLRGRALSNYLQNWRLVSPDFSRTDRIAELLEKLFYGPAIEDPWPGGRIAMDDLRITPLDDDGNPIQSFDPRTYPRKLATPVPILLLNATTLNTGHNWRFEATWIGEPEVTSVQEADVDKNDHLLQWRRSALPRLEPKLRTLGTAVASSGCFPGGLAPVAIPNLYVGKTADGEDDPYVVKLTDGGVRDNQGVDGLLDYGVTDLILSDGSGQMGDAAKPGSRLPTLLTRVNSIEGKESREQRILRAEASDQRVLFVHLLSGVPAETLLPTGAQPIPGWPPQPGPPGPSTGIAPAAQRLVAQMRTDLDAFSDLEASSVMEVGYRVTAAAAPPGDRGGGAPRGDWRFHAVGKLLESPDARYLRHLRVARQRFFKPALYRLDPLAAAARRLLPRPVRNALGILLGVLIAAALAYGGYGVVGSRIPAPVVYSVGIGLALAAVLYVKSETPGLRTVSHYLFDVVLVAVAAVLPLWLLGWAQLISGQIHRRQGPDGYEAEPEAPGTQYALR